MKMKNERTLAMRNAFIKLHEEGHSIRQIAEKFGLSTTTVYTELPSIAEENGVTKESLLERPHGKHLTYERCFEPVKPVDLTDFRRKFESAMAAMTETKELIDLYIEEAEAFEETYKEELDET